MLLQLGLKKGLFALLTWKSGGSVGWSPPPPPTQKISSIIHVRGILGHAELQNWFDPGVGRYCIPIYLVKIPFWESYCICIFWHFILTFLFKKYKIEYQKKKKKKEKEKKKKKPTLIFQYFGSVGKGQTNIFIFLGLIMFPIFVT